MLNLTQEKKRKLINKVLSDLNNKIRDFYLDVKTLSKLSKRRIYSILKLISKAENKKYSKKELKLLAKIIFYSDSTSDKKVTNDIFKNIAFAQSKDFIAKDYYKKIKKIIDSIISSIFSFHIFKTFFYQIKKYLYLGVMRI